MSLPNSYHLTNTKFENNAATLLQNLYAKESFSDVTIACDDGKVFKAHKIVLSASSAVFNQILMQCSETNLLIYFGDTNDKHIEYILQYAYFGEVSVEENELKEFMKTVQKFRINGLFSEQTKKVDLENIDLQKEGDSSPSISDKKIKENFNIEVDSKAVVFNCDRCEYMTTAKEYLRVHKRSIHEGVKYTCNECDYKATQQGNLMQHKLSVHGGVKYSCDKCDFKTTRPCRLNSHVREIHEGIEYPCLQCNHKERNRKRLNLHVQSVHQGISYPCDQCDFTNIEKDQLKRHQEMVHQGLRYLCDVDQCDYSAANRRRVTKHKSNVHSEKIKIELNK